MGCLPMGEVIKHAVDPKGEVRECCYKQWSEPWYHRAVQDLFKTFGGSQSAAAGASGPRGPPW